MARTYYDTPQRVYQLFKNHPSLSQIYSEFSIDIDAIKRVAEFLVLNHDKIIKYDLQTIYKSRTPLTIESDQQDPIVGEVDNFSNLPITASQGDVYYVKNPYPGKYYIWQGMWKEDPKSRDKSRILYLESLYEERGYKVWEDEYGYYIATDDGWQKVDNATPDYTIIRLSELPKNPTIGTIYEVLGEDLIDILASLYGFVDKCLTPPWNQYQSQRKTNLQELLNTTIYLYRYGVTDNFYEKNIWQFLPEYDREQMLSQPKIKLFMESIGRKLDQVEDKLTRLQDIYDIDETPDELLNYLGQMLGYEKEDFSLSNVSFRELLKNIIEIYKIKGTNYSFSFFFKFLGFNVNLKEFYFNKNVRNPESFPGMEEDNVEFYLTTVNPIYEINYGNPASYLRQIRSLNDWTLERDALIAKGCLNPISYMLGDESYNNGTVWHSNPWTYFKTNLIEYQLNPFFDKVNLTSSDNETIKKYIRFLSPTYLFTWINVNLIPWIEDFSVLENIEEYINTEIEKTLGDITPDGFKDYDNVEDYLQVWDVKQNKLIPYTEADEMTVSLINNLNLGGDDRVGAYLRRDGVYIRQPGHPSHITNVFHNGAMHLSFDNLGIMVKNINTIDYDVIYPQLSNLPATAQEDTIAFVEESGLYYIFKDPAPYWELIESIQNVPTQNISSTYSQLIQRQDAVVGEVYKTSDTGRYYKYHDDEPLWIQASDIEHRYKKWMDYSYRPYPSYPINVQPSPGIKLKTNIINFVWDDIYAQQGYWIQVAKDVNFTNIIKEEFIYDSRNYISNVLLENDNYYWRIRTKNNLSINQISEEDMSNIDTIALDYYDFNNGIYTIKNLNGNQLNELIKILSFSGYKFNWGQWSSIYRFELCGLPFPHNNQIINDLNYQHVEKVYDEFSGSLIALKIKVEWPQMTNIEKYEVVLSRQEDFSQLIYMTQTDANFISVNLPNGEYYWKYRNKKFNKDWEDWSDIMYFRIQI